MNVPGSPNRGPAPLVSDAKSYHVVAADQISAPNVERLLDAKVELIAVEDPQLASSLATSIQIGNVLHKVSVLSGLGGLLCASVLPSRSVPKALMPLTLVSLATAWTYNMTVCGDPISKYQIDREGSAATMLPTDALAPASTYSFLVRKDNTPRIFLHTSISAVTAFCFYRHAPEACNAAASRATAIVQNCIARTHPIARDLFAIACAGDLEGLVSRLQLTA